MNLRLTFALAAFLGVAACGDANAPANSARTAITPATPATPAVAPTDTAATTPAAGCPKAPAPKCPTVTRAKAASTTSMRRNARSSAERRVVATRTVREASAAHRGPVHREAHVGLPKRPYRYGELPRDRYDEPPVGLDDGDQLARRSWRERSSSYREGRAYDDEYSERGGERWRGHRHGDAERWSREPPRYDRYGAERRSYETRREGYASRSERSYAYEETETYSERAHVEGGAARVTGPCCRPARSQAAGFDANGFLTWPGKVPARP